MKSLEQELKSKLEQYKPKLQTVFIGGGTPSTVSSSLYEEIFKLLKPYLEKNAEITTEANPNSASKQWLEGMFALGVNRISFGVQSFNDEKLSFLGRAHTSKKAIEAINDAYGIGFKHINCDLIYGVEKDTLELLKEDIHIIEALPINHISAYSLTLEEGTKFFTNPRVKIDDEVLSAQLFEYLQNRGFEQYEISNFARSNQAQSKHNLGYWQYKEYLGIGAGAVGCIENRRYYAHTDIETFIQSPHSYEVEQLSSEEVKIEKVLLGLRSMVGFEASILNKEELQRADELVNKRHLLSENGCFYANNYLLADELALYLIK